ncbi:hypothetical protein [Luteibacter sp.]|uniref:DUF6988 family protein n=1 Tax=Luteibacter sp. TaxID=1886636 RepID=UPI0028068B52|nr:hypothetical protein [Luteibacter sp.]MDQ8051073.1 hypothetical protein [Luteibacter sp.]
METTVRALWLSYIAQFDVVTRLANATSRPDLDDMARAIKKANIPELSPIGEAVLKQGIFHSFAHAGIEQLIRRVRGYQEEEVLALLLISDTFAAMAMALAAKLYDDEPLSQLAELTGCSLALESHFRFGNPRPHDGWRAQFPDLPTWKDPH